MSSATHTPEQSPAFFKPNEDLTPQTAAPMPSASRTLEIDAVNVKPRSTAIPSVATTISATNSEKVSSDPGCHLPGFGFVAYKHVALVMLVVQTVGAILIMRVSRTIGAAEVPYIMTTAVVLAEVVKLVISFFLVLRENSYSLSLALARVNDEIISKPMDTLKVGIPALLYTVQNNLLFIALNNMSGALYQVTYQLKIMTTALLSVIILRRALSVDKWAILCLLTAGVALIQVPAGPQKPATNGGNVFVGTVAVLAACVTSGLAGVYLEKILKGSATSIWMRNMQLGFLGALLAIFGVLFNDYAAIRENGFFQGYNAATWAAVLMQSAGGIVVAAVLKFADNILKCFGNAVAIALSCLVSYYLLNDYTPSIYFVFGTATVIYATYAWSMDVKLLRNVLNPTATLR